jgi:hypothetical protein
MGLVYFIYIAGNKLYRMASETGVITLRIEVVCIAGGE